MLNTMANTYTQCYFHLVFAVKNRDALIKKEWKDELEKYIKGYLNLSLNGKKVTGLLPVPTPGLIML
jgi:hypothetical protein